MVSVLFVASKRSARAEEVRKRLQDMARSAGLRDGLQTDLVAVHPRSQGKPLRVRALSIVSDNDQDTVTDGVRVLRQSDFDRYDCVVCVDEADYLVLRRRCPQQNLHKLVLMGDLGKVLSEGSEDDPRPDSELREEEVFSPERCCSGILSVLSVTDRPCTEDGAAPHPLVAVACN